MSAPTPDTVAFTISGPIARADLPGLCDRVCALLGERRAGVALCDVCDVEPDAVIVDALLRLQLAARRNNCRIQLRGASPALCELVAFMGLADVLCMSPRSDELSDPTGSKFQPATEEERWQARARE